MPTYVADEVVTALRLNNGTARDWTTWTPSYTNLTVGSGTVVARYCQIGSELVQFYWSFVLGSGSAVATAPTISLPVAASTSMSSTGNFQLGSVKLTDASAGDWMGLGVLTSTTVLTLVYLAATAQIANITATAPFTWVSTDMLSISGSYEVA